MDADNHQAELRTYRGDADVPIDTSRLEQALRVIPMGRNYPRLVVMEGFGVRVSSNRRLFSSASRDLH